VRDLRFWIRGIAIIIGYITAAFANTVFYAPILFYLFIPAGLIDPKGCVEIFLYFLGITLRYTFIPMVVFLSVAEFMHLRRPIHFVLGGLIVSIAAWGAFYYTYPRPQGQITFVDWEPHLPLLIVIGLVSGSLCGYVYWLIAGRQAGGRVQIGTINRPS
jgi:hypothetical protein